MTRADVTAAAARIADLVEHTPILRCAAIDDAVGAEVWFKAENLQRVSAFKARGAFHAVGRLSDAERRAGIITYSSGNHAQAVALAARHYGAQADIAMPVDAPAIKVAAVEAMGARIVFAGHTSTDRHAAALDLQARTGATIIEPFDHPDTIAGQGTATLEFTEQVAAATSGGALDALLVPVGGGGLIAGACLAVADSATAVYAVEPVGCDSMGQSLARGEIVAVEPGPTLADGLKPTRVGELNFAIARARLAGSYTVGDDEIGRALITLLIRAKVVVEPSAAAAVAVALRGDLPGNPARIGVILSGGNIAPATLGKLLAEHAERL